MKPGTPKKAPKVAPPSKDKPNYMKEYRPSSKSSLLTKK